MASRDLECIPATDNKHDCSRVVSLYDELFNLLSHRQAKLERVTHSEVTEK